MDPGGTRICVFAGEGWLNSLRSDDTRKRSPKPERIAEMVLPSSGKRPGSAGLIPELKPFSESSRLRMTSPRYLPGPAGIRIQDSTQDKGM